MAQKMPTANYDGQNPDIGANPVNGYWQNNLWGRFSNFFAMFGPYKVPTNPLLGGGNGVARQLQLYAPNLYATQQTTPVSITGNGSGLNGQLTSLPLVDTNAQANSQTPGTGL